ncbi:MAG: hypothetical protein CVV16_12965, partial [Gammaproteobacteria bacterium HGW-Gammaproteobacteria-6]
MRKFLVSGVVSALLLSACVTINVYFPAAEAQEAAKEFVDKVIGVDAKPGASVPADSSGGGMAWLSFFIADAHAQAADITIRTPAIQA